MNDKGRKTLFLIDGSNYIFRAFYAVRELTNSKGFPTNAIYGFTNMLVRLLREYEPDYIACAFDLKGPTFRHDAYEAYKATRKATPEALIPQISYIKEIVRGFSIPVLERQGLEADDIIGTLARRFSRQGLKVVIISGDKDFMQLVNDDIIMVDTMKDKTYDIAAVKERFGVAPEKVVEIIGLTGDTSDNIPGVPGIGPKNALRLIEDYGSIDEIIKNLDRLTNARAKQSIREYSEQARMSRDLATIRTDADFHIDIEACRYLEPQAELLKELFQEFEFSSLLQDLKTRQETLEGLYAVILDADGLSSLSVELARLNAFSLEMITSTDGLRTNLIGISIAAGEGKAFYIPLGHDYYGAPAQLDEAFVLKFLTPLFAGESIAKHGHDLKAMALMLARRGLKLKGLGCDTMIAAYLLNPSRHGFDLFDVVREQLQRLLPSLKGHSGSGNKQWPPAMIKIDDMKEYACRRADAVFRLSRKLSEKLRQDKCDELFVRVEMPLVHVLAAMEAKGVLLDTVLLKDMSQEMHLLLSVSENNIYRLAGEKFNVNSPKQLQTILFDKLRLPRGRKTREGYSTDVEVLTALAASHELPAEILAYRSLAKLKSTYIDALPPLIHPDTGRIHTSYNQTVTATGRLSSSNPNLQNIPVRTPEGKRIRQAFVAPEGWSIIAADYSQIELRVLAHLSDDQALMEAFADGEDIHARTASDIFGVFPAMVTSEMRRQAKVINFGVLYGMSAFGLARELNISQKTAQAYIDGYFDKYRGVRRYLDLVLENAARNGYVTTLLNRRRYVPEINNSSAVVRQFAERTAVNTPIQGTAADIIKVAMVNIFRVLNERRMQTAMIMQVHDELVFESPHAEVEQVVELVTMEMENVMPLKAPLKVDTGVGQSWDAAHG